MNEIVEANRANKIEIANNRPAGIELSGLLADTRTEFDGKSVTTIPIAELAALGAGVSSLVPAFRTVTQTTSVAVDGVFRIANAVTGDTLKLAQNGNAWGALKTAAGKSKMAQLAMMDTILFCTFSPPCVLDSSICVRQSSSPLLRCAGSVAITNHAARKKKVIHTTSRISALPRFVHFTFKSLLFLNLCVNIIPF